MYQPKLEKDIRCPLEYGLEIFGGKWKSRIICVLAEMKTLRYSELRKEMSNITDAVLASTLKELIRDKIVERKSFDEIPPHVEYSLSEKGLSVVPILQNICKWSGIFYNEDNDNTFTQCQKCNYRSQIFAALSPFFATVQLNERRPRHEERAHLAPLSLFWWR